MVAMLMIMFLLAIFAFESGPMRRSVFVIALLVSLGHLMLMACVRPWVNALDPRELVEWYDGHIKNYAWAAGIAFLGLWFG